MKRLLFFLAFFASVYGKVNEVNSFDELANEISNSESIVFVDCYSNWCPPCQTLIPLFERWSDKYSIQGKFLKINVNKVSDLPSKYKISTIPTVLIFDSNGKLSDKKVGLKEIQEFFNSFNQNMGLEGGFHR